MSPVTPTTIPMMAIMTPAMMGVVEELHLHPEEKERSSPALIKHSTYYLPCTTIAT